MTFYNKIKWVLGILMVFVLILATNLIDRNNFLRVKDSVITIYNDRIVANDIIFEMSRLVQEKEVAMAKQDSIFFVDRNKEVNLEVQALITRFEQTKLTVEEGKIFNAFKDDLKALQKSEAALTQSGLSQTTALENQIRSVEANLYKLSKIQLSEGRRQTSLSKKAISSIELFTHMEIYILVFLAILVQIIVIYKPKEEE
jgi:hypothetical protein